MLRKFKVSNFKGFEKDFELDLTNINGYEFNKDAIKNGVVNNAIIYGENGVGKSNLALAIFDIVGITDKEQWEAVYNNYLNAFCNSNVAHFYYEFLINSKIVVYEYKKYDYKTIVYERFTIDNKELAFFDRANSSKATVQFEGAETLKTEIENPELSILKYVKNNALLAKNEVNTTFMSFFTFVEKMLYFRSLQENIYIGLVVGKKDALESIIKKGNLQDFEIFLNQAGVECKLVEVEEFARKTIAFDFNGKKLRFLDVASTGTVGLALFYLWYQELKENNKVSFLFLDEFDAFYHHALSTLVVEKLKETGVQFILTTHNTSIMTNDLLRPDCYFVMTKKQIRSFSNSTEKELRQAHNIEKMYKAGAFYVE